jgi:hypothetical protein
MALGLELVFGKVDIVTDGKGIRVYLTAQAGRVVSGVDPYITKIGAKTWLHEMAHAGRERTSSAVTSSNIRAAIGSTLRLIDNT